VVIPNKTEREYINKIIFDELCAGKILQESKERFIQIIACLAEEEGAEGVILGCTEIPLLVKQEDVSVPVFDTTAIHSEAAVRYSLNGKKPLGRATDALSWEPSILRSLGISFFGSGPNNDQVLFCDENGLGGV